MPVDHHTNIIEINKLHFAYANESVLQDITLNIHQGDYLGIVGPNGGGKTTLLRLILGLLTPQSGTIKLFGTPLAQFKDWKSIGYVPQHATNIDLSFPITVEEVVRMGRLSHKKIFQSMGKEDDQAVDKALREVDMTPYRKRQLSDLSGGQQQRVFIARALATEPKILFLDEPTVGVDTATQTEFYTLLKHLNTALGITLVLVSHDIDVVAKETTEIACINRELVYEADPHSLLSHGKLESLYGPRTHFISHHHT